MAQAITAKEAAFAWEGTDKKGKRVKGRMLAASEAAVRADLRKQGVLARKVRKEIQLFKSGKKSQRGRYLAIQSPARNDAGSRHSYGSVL